MGVEGDAASPQRRFLALQRREFLIVERGMQRPKPVRPLGVADRRHMIEECRMVQEKGGQGAAFCLPGI